MSELYHHGILGQKWGVRRAEHYPLNPADHSAEQLRKNPAIKRELKAKKAMEKAEKRKSKILNRFVKVSRKASKKSDLDKVAKMAKNMTDEELKKANARLTLENTYINLIKNNSPAQEKRMKWAREAMSEALKTVGKQVATVAFSKAANLAASKLLGQNVEIVNPLSGGIPNSKKQDTQKPQTSKPDSKPNSDRPEKPKPENESGHKQEPKSKPAQEPKSDVGEKISKLPSFGSTIVPVQYTTPRGTVGIRYAPRESVSSSKAAEQVVPVTYKTSNGNTGMRYIARNAYEETYRNSVDEERRKRALDTKPKKR